MSQAIIVAERAEVAASNQNDQPGRLVAYIRDVLQELAKLSPTEAGPVLPYLIDMARLEAQETEHRLSITVRQ